jgi:hypothetical protein
MAQTPPDAGLYVNQGAIWTLRTENDKFSTVPGGTDRYYTTGQQITWTSSPNEVPAFLAKFGQMAGGNGTTWLSVAVGQDLYTPIDTMRIHPDPKDWPYAGHLAATATLIQDSDAKRTMLSAGLGVIGPSAGGRLVQNGFHVAIGGAQSHGWGAQLPDEPALQFNATRIWRTRLAAVGPFEADLLPEATIGLGTVRTYGEIGTRLRIGHGLDRDFGPARITNGQTGGDAYLPGDGIGYYLFVGASGQAVARDAFLDGDLFRPSISVHRRSLVGQFEGGLALLWRSTRISYTHTWQTDSFQGQKAGLFNFGSIAVSFRF